MARPQEQRVDAAAHGGIGIARLLQTALPRLPVQTPPEYIAAALLLSLAVGLLSGVLPARCAAVLDPIEALRAE